jgi:hypothetical protein
MVRWGGVARPGNMRLRRGSAAEREGRRRRRLDPLGAKIGHEVLFSVRPRESGDPGAPQKPWIPACAGNERKLESPDEQGRVILAPMGLRRGGLSSTAAISARHRRACGRMVPLPHRCARSLPRSNPGLPGLGIMVRRLGWPNLRRGRAREGACSCRRRNCQVTRHPKSVLPTSVFSHPIPGKPGSDSAARQ